MSREKLEHIAGVTISVGSLRTENSCGCGDFADLKTLALFCKKSGLGLIQLLPVNDTGTESSPYSALSAFALHPLYIRLDAVPGFDVALDDIKQLRSDFDGRVRFSYQEVRRKKLAILRKIFNAQLPDLKADTALADWMKQNPWVVAYAVFMCFKAEFNEASWKEWPEKYRSLCMNMIQKRWNTPKYADDCLFYAWVQMNLDAQFSDAASYLYQNGILLKGDIPIMMNEDSCDAWIYPQYFRTDLRAGSPPDGFNVLGQNWGFPIYNWNNLEKDSFSWWKDRLHQAAKYYRAFRIDHILGFFRIWAIPDRDITGYSGWTEPCAPITVAEMAGIGFTGDRLRWISRAHVPTSAVQNALNGDYLAAHGVMEKLMNRIGNEELWLFKDTVTGERDIYEADIPEQVKGVLSAWYRNRMMIIRPDGTYAVSWCFRDSQAWNSLLEDERSQFLQLQQEKAAMAEEMWEQQARKLLGVLTSCTGMIACAEDLGANPACIAPVLADLGINSLKVHRWAREWAKDGQPYIPVETYPKLSVTTPAVHDSSTVRGWWNKEGGREDMIRVWPDGEALANKPYTPEAAEFLLSHLASAQSQFYIVQIQDFLALDSQYYAPNEDDERINRPGSVNDFNWTYRLPVTLEELIQNDVLSARIKKVLGNRAR